MTNRPNPAQQRRSKVIAAIREQQTTIESQKRNLDFQAAQIHNLTQAVATLAVAAGVERHPKFAGLVRQAGVRVRANSDTNNGDSIGGAPSTTTEEAKKPDATDSPESIGAAPAPANVGVTPTSVTDVNTTDVSVSPPALDNLQDVTQPTAGTDSPVPDAGNAESASTVTVSTPSTEPFDKPGDSGWTASKDDQRFMASLRLARLRISAGIARGEDLVVAQQIAASKETLPEITAQVNALSAVASQQAAQAPRNLVPRSASRQTVRQPSMQATSATTRVGDDEWMVGSVD